MSADLLRECGSAAWVRPTLCGVSFRYVTSGFRFTYLVTHAIAGVMYFVSILLLLLHTTTQIYSQYTQTLFISRELRASAGASGAC